MKIKLPKINTIVKNISAFMSGSAIFLYAHTLPAESAEIAKAIGLGLILLPYLDIHNYFYADNETEEKINRIFTTQQNIQETQVELLNNQVEILLNQRKFIHQLDTLQKALNITQVTMNNLTISDESIGTNTKPLPTQEETVLVVKKNGAVP